MNYKSISEENFAEYVDLMSIVLVTVTQIEKECLHERLTPLHGLENILVVQKQFYTYYLGMLGKYAVCHVESRMGSSGAGASTMTVQQAIEFVKPTFIMMVGIAFGVNNKEQRIGDVLVSELIIQYENIKVKRGKIQCRGYKQMSSVLLLNRFVNPIGWEFALTPTRRSRVLSGNMLSGEKLIDDVKYRNQLVRLFEPVVGGEMEGTGLASVAHAYSKNWLVIKGICDFADGNKGINKVKKQYLAARAAVDLCCNVFNDNFTFKDLGVFPLETLKEEDNVFCKIDQTVFRDATFNAYSVTKEAYYLNREIDVMYSNYIAAKANIWSFGKSGMGKTCMTFRNLIQAGKRIFVIDFSSIEASNMLSFFEYMQARLLDFVDHKDTTWLSPVSIMQAMDNICEIANRYLNDSYIVMEEMPVDDDNDNVFKHVFSLIVKNSIQYPDSAVNFAFTSIGDPKKRVLSMAEKIGEKINFLEAIEWTTKEMSLLLQLMLDMLNCNIGPHYSSILVEKSYNNPRKLKTNLRDLILFSQFKDQPFETSLQQYFETDMRHE
ncbi:5'-methylthioadenosine/S-adenosylhomocysteine nucleosidase family protein [Hymenobacter cavernae]|uniref:Nucleoside phosphorylase domain-containing protein n=1 Tax=Hymenobacter cavernae TaxID=2044852 RepID=A0ABQ1UXN0_9BACT|nr:hypothetical protein [Hymenobacter cavernae]GGF27891.1 hypothetical protein GCM10011383_44470 [Hymenobacter cavernae]